MLCIVMGWGCCGCCAVCCDVWVGNWCPILVLCFMLPRMEVWRKLLPLLLCRLPGGYLGVMAKLVEEIADLEWGGFGKVDDPLFGEITNFTYMAGTGGWVPGCCCGCWIYTAWSYSGHGCSRNCRNTTGIRCSHSNTGWHILLSAQSLIVIDVVEILWIFLKLWWYPNLLKYKCLNLSMCFALILLCPCSLILLMNWMHFPISWSCWFIMFLRQE